MAWNFDLRVHNLAVLVYDKFTIPRKRKQDFKKNLNPILKGSEETMVKFILSSFLKNKHPGFARASI